MQRYNDDINNRLDQLLEEREKSMNKPKNQFLGTEKLTQPDNTFIQPNKGGQFPINTNNSDPVVLATDNDILNSDDESAIEQKKDNTALYIVGGVVVIAGLFILYNSVKKDKKIEM